MLPAFIDGSPGFVIADVSGHGPGTAVVMAMLRTATPGGAEALLAAIEEAVDAHAAGRPRVDAQCLVAVTMR